MKLSAIHINPNNPRLIKDDRFKKLCKSIEEFPKMMKLRPIIVDADGMILGGNMRFKALQELKYKDIPDEWVKRDGELTDEEKQRFIVADNIGFGEWDWDILANEWNEEELVNWGLELPHGWNNDDITSNDVNKMDENLLAIVVVAYNNINDLDKLTSLYELDRIEITEDIKNKLLSQGKMYVFKE